MQQAEARIIDTLTKVENTIGKCLSSDNFYLIAPGDCKVKGFQVVVEVNWLPYVTITAFDHVELTPEFNTAMQMFNQEMHDDWQKSKMVR